MMRENTSGTGYVKPVLFSLVCLLIVVIVMSYATSSQKQLAEYAYYTVEQNAISVSQSVDAYINSALSSIQLTSHLTAKGMSGPELENASEVLTPLLERTPFNFIEYINHEGMNATEKGERFDASDREYYIQGIAGQTGIWINYNPRYSEEYLLNFYTPLEYEGQTVGVLTGTLGSDSVMLPLLESSFFGESTIGILCDAQGNVISATAELPRHARIQDVLDYYGIGDEGSAAFYDHIARQDSSVFDYHGIEGQSIACVSVNQRTGWIIAQVVPSASFQEVVRQISGRTYGATLAIATLLGVYLLYILFDTRKQQRAIVQQQERALAEQVAVSNTDALTGLPNRRAYEDDLMVYPKVPTEPDYVYVSIDVNGLKIANDNLGHEAGDELLIGAADCLKRCLGSYGKVYRVGGDEFAAMIFTNEERLVSIRKDLEDNMHAWRGKLVSELAMSCGYAAKSEFPEATVIELSRIADKRMYEAKALYYRTKGVDRRGQQTAYAALCSSYTKILRINLTTDAYHIIFMDTTEQTEEMGFAQRISAWLHDFGVSGQVHPDDLTDYLAKIDLAYLRSWFADGKRHLSIFYRRRINGQYRMAMMEMLPADDYTDQNQSLFLYVKDIDRISKA